MKTLKRQARYLRPTCGKVIIALAFASAISVLPISPALAEHGHGHEWGEWRGEHGHHWGWREHPEGYGRYGGYGGFVYQQPYIYSQPVYVPPPVYYPPMQSPGISLFFPLYFRH